MICSVDNLQPSLFSLQRLPCCAKLAWSVLYFSHTFRLQSWLTSTQGRGPFHKQFFHCDSNSPAISFCSHQSCSEVIAMKFCTWCKYVLPWHGQNFVVKRYPTMELHFAIKFEIQWQNCLWNGPQINKEVATSESHWTHNLDISLYIWFSYLKIWRVAHVWAYILKFTP